MITRLQREIRLSRRQCGWRESNPHAQNGHRRLRPAWLPFTPHPQAVSNMCGRCRNRTCGLLRVMQARLPAAPIAHVGHSNVRATGIEPARAIAPRSLNPLRLPVPPHPQTTPPPTCRLCAARHRRNREKRLRGWCARRESNPHARNGHQSLRLTCLPFHHSRAFTSTASPCITDASNLRNLSARRDSNSRRLLPTALQAVPLVHSGTGTSSDGSGPVLFSSLHGRDAPPLNCTADIAP